MILLSLEVRYWRHLLNPLAVTFRPGLNVVVGPNEAGKTTLQEALGHALFERADSGREALQVIRPKGRDLKPFAAVEFESGGQSYRVEKTFFESRGHTLLKRRDRDAWQPLAQDRDAEARLAAILEEDGLARNRQVIWSTQGDLKKILATGLSAELKERLGAVLAGLLLTDADRDFIGVVEQEWNQRFTPKRRQPKDGSDWRRALDELAKAKERAEAADGDWRDYERLRRDLEESQRKVGGLDEETGRLKDRLAKARGEKASWDSYRQAAAEADGAGNQAQVRGDLRRSWVDVIEKLERTEARCEAIRDQAAKAQVEVERAQGDYDRARAAAAESGRQQQTLANQRELLRLWRAREMEERLASLATAAPAAPLADEMKRLRRLKQGVDAARLRLEATALRVRLTPERDLTGRVSRDGGPDEDFRAAPVRSEEWSTSRSLRLLLDGIASLEVETGVRGATDVQDGLEKATAEFSAELDRWLPGREDLEARWTALEERFERAEELRDERARLEDAFRAAFDFPPGEAVSRLGAWRAEHPEAHALAVEAGWEDLDGERLLQLERAADADLAASGARIKAEALVLETCLATLGEKQEAAARARSALAGLEGEKRTLLAGLKAVREQARKAEPVLAVYSARDWTEEERFDRVAEQSCELLARLTRLAEEAAARWGELSRKAEALRPEGQEVTEAGLGELEQKLAWLQAALTNALGAHNRLSGTVQARADGLGGGRREAEELLHQKRDEAAFLEREAGAWDLLRQVLDEERSGQLAGLLDPVRDRVQGRLGRVTGGRYHQVTLDPEGLQPTAVTGADVSLEVGKELSFGTEEQLALLARLALAELLVPPGGRQVVVLDDPLANTDPARQASAWQVLLEAAEGLQLILLTCHPIPVEVEARTHVIDLA